MTKVVVRCNEFLKVLCQSDAGVISGTAFKLCERSVVLFSTCAHSTVFPFSASLFCVANIFKLRS